VDLHGRFTSVNAGLLAEAGLPRDAVLDQHFASLVHAADRPTALTMVAETLGGHRHRLQMRFLGAKGPRMGIITKAPIHEQGKVVGALVDFDGERLIRVSTRERDKGVDVLVTDTGPGITSPHLARILEPMFTTRTAQGNRGLGYTIAHAISRFLRNTGYSVKVAEGGAEALALLAERSYDQILLGLRMKEMTGSRCTS
jgi:hypothetical protein